MSSLAPVPEVVVVRKPLQFFWIADHSGSMTGKKIATLNHAIREAAQVLVKAVQSHPEVAVMMRAIKFSDNANWHVGPAPVPLEQFVWPELRTAGGTSTAQALRLLGSELADDRMPHRGYPPVCILLSDGFCTDPPEDYDRAISQIQALEWGKRAVRLSIAVGSESEYDEAELLKFVSHPEIGVLKADTPEKLIEYIRWASVSASIAASAGKSRAAGQGGTPYVAMPAPPQPTAAVGGGDLDTF